MYLAGVSVRRVKDITEALWGTRVSPSTVSELNQKIYKQIEEWRNRRIEGQYTYVYLDGIWLSRSWGGSVEKVSVLVAIGVPGTTQDSLPAVGQTLPDGLPTRMGTIGSFRLTTCSSSPSAKLLGAIRFVVKSRWRWSHWNWLS